MDAADSGRPGRGYPTAAWSGRRPFGAATHAANVGGYGATDARGGAKGKGTARTCSVAITASGHARANARITVGSADNNARVDGSDGPEQLFPAITAPRCHPLRRQAAAGVVGGYRRVGDGGATGTFDHRGLKPLVDAEVAKVRDVGTTQG
jgi:hypothetical protein